VALTIATMLATGTTGSPTAAGVALPARQAGTPTAVGLPVVPAPAECTVAPVPFAELPAVQAADRAATPPAPLLPAGGAPATPEQSASFLATLRLQIACLNAGDIPRALALTGSAYRDRVLAQSGTPTEAQYAVLATPLPRTDGTVIAITALDGITSGPDGTLAATVTTLTSATTVNLVTLSPSSTSPTGYVITDQRQLSRATPTRTPIT